MSGYVLTAAAEADLREIVRYTRREWGDPQARKYVASLKLAFENTATGALSSKPLDDLHPGLRVARCEQHFVFCLPRTNAPALIVAILHRRMDLMARMTKRLGE